MKTLLLMTVVAFVSADFSVRDVADKTETLDLIAVAGYKAGLPCDVEPPPKTARGTVGPSKDEVVVMILWYREETSKHPIFRVDARERNLRQAKQWSDPRIFGDRATMRSDVKPTELEISPLTMEDQGLYLCRVDFKDSPTKNYNINLTIVDPPQKPRIYNNTDDTLFTRRPFDEGSKLSLTCKVMGGVPPPRVVWYLGGELLDDTYTREQANITVNHLNVTVSRDFLNASLICRASNTYLVAPVTSEIILDVNLKPVTVNITNKQSHISALQTYEVECTTSGSRPEAVITWWKGPHQVKHMARNFAEGSNVTRSVLSYVPTIEDNKKFLICRAENPSVSSSALEDAWHLVIHYVPVVTIKFGASLKPHDINEGDDVYFECDVKANPVGYKLGWFKNGKELHQNVSAGILLPGRQSLVLQRVTRLSAGEYSCMAANVEGTAISSPVTLEVMYAPICKDGSIAQVVGALKHETISLVCGVQSKPPPTTFHWTFNNSGELMNVPSNRFTQIKPLKRITNHWHGSRLNYTPDDDMDYGTVSCSARNKIGLQRTPCLFQIIVAGKPYPLQNCSALQSTGPYAYRMGHDDFKTIDSQDSEWLIVRCSEGFDGGLPLTGFELEVYSEDSADHTNRFYQNRSEKSNIPGHQGPVFEVPGLEPGRNYRLLLYAINAKGRSDPVVLEPVSLKGVAMYTTGRGSSEKSTDYSLLVACFAGGITAVCILVVGVTLTLYRRNHPMQPIKTQTHVVHCESKEDHSMPPIVIPGKDPQRDFKDSRVFRDIKKDPAAKTTSRVVAKESSRDQQHQYQQQFQLQLQSSEDPTEENPDVIPNKVDRRTVICEPNYTPKIERTKTGEFRDHLEGYEYPSPGSVLHAKDTTWIYPNGYADRPEEMSPARPSTLPVHRTHDIYTRSSRVQESCI